MSKPTTPKLTEKLAAEPDLVDRIFDYLASVSPEFGARITQLEEAKAAVRDEFGGQEVYVRSGNAGPARIERSRELAQQVLSMFNGRNATEVARELGIGRSTVYRLLKQAGRADTKKLSHSSP